MAPMENSEGGLMSGLSLVRRSDLKAADDLLVNHRKAVIELEDLQKARQQLRELKVVKEGHFRHRK
jgi:hypothetical protein